MISYSADRKADWEFNMELWSLWGSKATHCATMSKFTLMSCSLAVFLVIKHGNFYIVYLSWQNMVICIWGTKTAQILSEQTAHGDQSAKRKILVVHWTIVDRLWVALVRVWHVKPGIFWTASHANSQGNLNSPATGLCYSD